MLVRVTSELNLKSFSICKSSYKEDLNVSYSLYSKFYVIETINIVTELWWQCLHLHRKFIFILFSSYIKFANDLKIKLFTAVSHIWMNNQNYIKSKCNTLKQSHLDFKLIKIFHVWFNLLHYSVSKESRSSDK